jgi:hypothetical protein
MADFEISETLSKVVCHPCPGVAQSTLEHLLQDQVIPRLLSHRGVAILHGSCVHLGQRAVAFLGESGRGKSTLASYFHQRGFDLLADDSIQLEARQECVYVVPGISEARLWEDSLAALQVGEDSRPMAHYCSKRRVPLGRQRNEKLPLRVVFVLGDPTTGPNSVGAETLPGAEALTELLRCSLTLDVTDPEAISSHFKKLGAIAAHPGLAIRKLYFPRKYDELPRVFDAILTYVEAL